MSSRSLNEILIEIPTELFDFIFASYNICFILPGQFKGTMHAQFNSIVLFTVLYLRFQHCTKDVSKVTVQRTILEYSLLKLISTNIYCIFLFQYLKHGSTYNRSDLHSSLTYMSEPYHTLVQVMGTACTSSTCIKIQMQELIVQTILQLCNVTYLSFLYI